MSAGRADVREYVEVTLDQFETKDVLAYAAELIREHKATKKPEDGYRLDKWRVTDEAIEDVAKAVGYSIPNGDEDAYPYPPSTAARITSLDALRAHCGRRATP